MEELLPRLGILEPSLLEVGHVVRGRERDPEPWHGLPAGGRVRALARERIPAAVLLAELVDHVADIGVLLLEQERVGVAGQDHVVARLHLRLGRSLGGQLQVGDGVDPHGDTRLLAEYLGLTAQLVVGGGNEVVPAEERQLALLGERGRTPEGQPGRHAGGCAGSYANKVSTRGTLHRHSLKARRNSWETGA